MNIEQGTIIAIEPDCLWVESVQTTSCGNCAVNSGCGTGIMTKLSGKSHRVRVLQNPSFIQTYHIGQQIKYGIEENIIVKSAFLLYIVPLLLMLIMAGVASSFFESDFNVLIGLILGLVLSTGFLQYHSRKHRDNPHYHPIALP